MQIFVKNANRWQAKPLADAEIEKFRKERIEHGIDRVVAHASYLINLSATDPANLAKSIAALGDELDRCHALGVDGLVVHPGAHLGEGPEVGVAKVAESIDLVFAERPDCSTRLLLENTAGQGTVLGSTLEELAAMISQSKNRERIGVCLDTCHAFAAGYPIHTEEGYAEFWQLVDEKLPAGQPECLHLNDSAKPFDSHRDRHASLGDGEIGLDLFERLVNDPRLADTPMILETPLGDDGLGHQRDLEILRGFTTE